MENKTIKAIIIGVIVILIVASLVLIIKNVIKSNKNLTNATTTTTTTTVINPKASSNKFSLKEEAGYVVVKGYAEVKKISVDDEDSTESADYVYFHITETDNEDFLKYIKESKGNLFVADKAIGIGSVKDNVISYYNAYDDEKGDLAFYNYSFSQEDSNTILNSSKTNQITLKMDKLKFTNGFGGADLSYSHMTYIEIVK